MIRAIFWSVATAQVNGIDNYYMFLDSTDPLEQNFGIIRDLHGPGTQASLLLEKRGIKLTIKSKLG
jgi:hypothetical protein